MYSQESIALTRHCAQNASYYVACSTIASDNYCTPYEKTYGFLILWQIFSNSCGNREIYAKIGFWQSHTSTNTVQTWVIVHFTWLRLAASYIEWFSENQKNLRCRTFWWPKKIEKFKHFEWIFKKTQICVCVWRFSKKYWSTHMRANMPTGSLWCRKSYWKN